MSEKYFDTEAALQFFTRYIDKNKMYLLMYNITAEVVLTCPLQLT